jgi:Na+/phosphate symporter
MKISLLMVMLLFVKTAFAQHIADSFQNAEAKGYSMQALDKQYPSAIGSGNVVFKGDNEKHLITAYTTMIQDLNSYLNKNDFKWGSKVHIFNRIYFEPDGSISYYLVNLAPTGLTEAKQARFLTLLNAFIQDYKIDITAKTRFAQCSPVVYQDVNESTKN